jgi:hypothetical protein
MKIALISCSKLKRNYTCAAAEMYAPSELFSLSYQYSKRIADKIYILSAKYGLIPEDRKIAPYDLTLADMPTIQQLSWANGVLQQLSEECDMNGDEFIILAGRHYYQHLLPKLAHWSLPLGSLRIGPRIQFLKQQLENPPQAPVAVHRSKESMCGQLHQIFNALPQYAWQDIARIPFHNGIYIVFEKGEAYGNLRRIVRVGTHTSANRLRNRLRDHFDRENHNGSIFRKNIGKAILNRRADPYLAVWTLNTDRPENATHVDPEREAAIEREVSAYLRDNLSFAVFQINDAQQRLRLEEAIIATLNRAVDFQPSDTWLGQFSPEWEIRNSGMWLKKGLDALPLTAEELRTIEAAVGTTLHTEPFDLEDEIAGTHRSVSMDRWPYIHSPEQTAAPVLGRVEIRKYIHGVFEDCQQREEHTCTLISGDIHRALGLQSKMPSVCGVMYQMMRPGDEVLHTTPSGKSSTIKIKYHL